MSAHSQILESALRASWSADVTWTPERYEGAHSSTGCCGVCAYAVWFITGLPILTADVDGQPHYWCEGYDLTAEQFAPGTVIGPGRWIHHSELLVNDWLRGRADLYLGRVLDAMDAT